MGQICSSESFVEPLETLTADQLTASLTLVGTYLSKKRTTFTLVTVGGAINTLYLRSRSTTHDVDFFSRTLTYEEIELLRKATAEASIKLGAPERWLNNQTSVFLQHDVRLRLVQEAADANEVIFSSGGLIILAAPWRYSLCSKLDRIHAANTDPTKYRTYDMSDAVA